MGEKIFLLCHKNIAGEKISIDKSSFELLLYYRRGMYNMMICSFAIDIQMAQTNKQNLMYP